MKRGLFPACSSALALLIASALFLPVTHAAESTAALSVGDPAPPFALMGSDGRIHKLSDSLGKRVVVLAWFARAFSGG